MSSNSAVGNIKHVIVLMFENRSFDHILGAMPGVDGVTPDLYNTMNPKQPAGDDNPATSPIPIVPASTPEPTFPTEAQVLVHDFTHEYGDGMLQDLFGPGTTAVLNGKPQNNPAVTYPSTNAGFLSTIAYNVSGYPPNGPSALSYFNWGSMEIFHTLAQSFLVCDAWHCDMPGHTAPNRAFMHCATTGDMGIDDNDATSPMVNRLTIFERIQDTGATWKMYWPGSNCDTNWLNEQVYSQQYTPKDPMQYNVTRVPIENLFTDLENGTLPFYSFIMCWNPYAPDTSMHPASQVEPGETMLACIYNSLRESQYWTDALLVVNFDENGGMYDHRSVPQTNPPDPGAPAAKWISSFTNRCYSFDFSVLGARIPVLLISPWLKAGICNTQYQNTSILRFLQDMLPNANSNNPYSLTQRDLNAPSIAPVFDYSQFGTQQTRSDCPAQIPGYGGVNACKQYLAWITNTASLAAPPAPHIDQITRGYLFPLPGHSDSGKPITREFATIGEMLAYAEERRQAALAYINAKKADSDHGRSIAQSLTNRPEDFREN